MPRKKAKKARKVVKFKSIEIKLTSRQKKSLVNYCLSRKTTPNKLIKRCLRPFLDKYADLEVFKVKKEKVNQLELF